jgi:hypothetical protein
MRLLGLLAILVCGVLTPGARAQWSSPGNNVVVVYGPQAPPRPVMVVRERPAPDEVRDTSYLIAFKNSDVRKVDQYWVSGNTLYYVTTDRRQMTAPLDSVDRALSHRLNSEQDVAFVLPAVQEKVAQAHVIHNTASSAHKRCCCVTMPSAARTSSHANGTASRASK